MLVSQGLHPHGTWARVGGILGTWGKSYPSAPPPPPGNAFQEEDGLHIGIHSQKLDSRYGVLLHDHVPTVAVLPCDPLTTAPWILTAHKTRPLDDVIPLSVLDPSEMKKYQAAKGKGLD